MTVKKMKVTFVEMPYLFLDLMTDKVYELPVLMDDKLLCIYIGDLADYLDGIGELYLVNMDDFECLPFRPDEVIVEEL